MTYFNLFEEYVETEFSNRVLIQAYIVTDDSEPKLSMHIQIEDRQFGRQILSQKLDFVATNPIWLAQFDPPAALGAYGLCIATKLAHSTYDQVAKCYEANAAAHPDDSLMDRIRKTAECVGANSQAIKQEVKTALKECLTFGLIFGDP